LLPPDGTPLTADLATSQFQSVRAKQKRLDESRVSGIRSVLYGLVAGGGAGLLSYVLPPSLWIAAALLGGLASLLVLFGCVRLIAAALLARKR
jgi:hypothetical protein